MSDTESLDIDPEERKETLMTQTQDRATKSGAPKNRWRRILLGTMLGGIGLGVFSRMAVGWAGGGGPHGRWRHGDPAEMREHMEERLQRLLDEVDATAEQETRILAIAGQAFDEIEPYRTERDAAHKRAREILTQATVDRTALETLRAAQVQNFEVVSKRFTQALADIADVLTPEQRTTLANHLARRRHRHGPL